MIGRGDPEENRRKAEAHGFEFPVALQRQWEISKAYGIFATPAAFLIGPDGLIAQQVATDVDAIAALACEAIVK
jgi:peroxiredoxin